MGWDLVTGKGTSKGFTRQESQGHLPKGPGCTAPTATHHAHLARHYHLATGAIPTQPQDLRLLSRKHKEVGNLTAATQVKNVRVKERIQGRGDLKPHVGAR